ncbi:MAG: DUF4282 domain-containing protein [Acidiferrobacteraceae bacterium]
MPSFFASLFDFSFERFVTPKLAAGIYILETAAGAIAWIAFGLKGFASGFFHGAFDLVVIAPIGFILTLILLRVGLELLIAIFRIAEHTKEIADSKAR